MTKFALFGLGGVGAFHRAAIERQERLGRARLVAVADPTVDRMPGVKEELEGRGVRWHMDYRDLLRLEQEVDAVVIATPIPLHQEMAAAAIARGVQVNLEKPPVPLIDQLQALILADKARRVSVGFQMIGSRCVQALKALLSAGKIGQVREIRGGGCWPRLDTYYTRARWAGKLLLDGKPVLDGPATNALAHLVHNIMYLAAEGRHAFAIPAEVEGELYRARPTIESYDTACMKGRFASGVTFSVAVTHATRESLPYRLEISGSHGWARLSEDGGRLESSCGIQLHEPETTQQLLDGDYDRFVEALDGRGRFNTCLEDARGYVAATNAMFVSSGAIRDIPATFVGPWEKDGAGGFDVAGLFEAVEDSLLTGRLFSEQKCAWAASGPSPVRTGDPKLGHRLHEMVAAAQNNTL